MKKLMILSMLLTSVSQAALIAKRLTIIVLTDSTGLALQATPSRGNFQYGDSDSAMLNASTVVTYTLTSSDSACLSTLYGEYLAAGKKQVGISP